MQTSSPDNNKGILTVIFASQTRENRLENTWHLMMNIKVI